MTVTTYFLNGTRTTRPVDRRRTRMESGGRVVLVQPEHQPGAAAAATEGAPMVSAGSTIARPTRTLTPVRAGGRGPEARAGGRARRRRPATRTWERSPRERRVVVVFG